MEGQIIDDYFCLNIRVHHLPMTETEKKEFKVHQLPVQIKLPFAMFSIDDDS
jgi:hypothetical protein